MYLNKFSNTIFSFLNTLEKNYISGVFSGCLFVGGLFFKFLMIFFAIHFWVATKPRCDKAVIRIIGLFIVILSLVSMKFYFLGTYKYSYLVQLYPLIVLTLTFTRRIDLNWIQGFFLPIFILFSVDFLFNLSTLLLGFDLIGRVPGTRIDGVRLGGVFGHSFYSLSISSAVLLLSIFLKKSNFFLYFALLNFLWLGTLRSFVYLFGFATFYIFRKKSLKFHFFLSITVAALTVFATYMSLRLGFSEVGSGNYFRTYAWEAAIENISSNFFWGCSKFFSDFNSNMGISKETILASGITESPLLTDWLHWGLLFVLIKVLFITYLGNFAIKSTYKEISFYSFIYYIIFLDYFISGLLGNMLLGFTVALLFSSFEIGFDNKNYKSFRGNNELNN